MKEKCISISHAHQMLDEMTKRRERGTNLGNSGLDSLMLDKLGYHGSARMNRKIQTKTQHTKSQSERTRQRFKISYGMRRDVDQWCQ